MRYFADSWLHLPFSPVMSFRLWHANSPFGWIAWMCIKNILCATGLHLPSSSFMNNTGCLVHRRVSSQWRALNLLNLWVLHWKRSFVHSIIWNRKILFLSKGDRSHCMIQWHWLIFWRRSNPWGSLLQTLSANSRYNLYIVLSNPLTSVKYSPGLNTDADNCILRWWLR